MERICMRSLHDVHETDSQPGETEDVGVAITLGNMRVVFGSNLARDTRYPT
jgi:hypothetical protein